MNRILLAALAVALLVPAGARAQAPAAPFGHPCRDQNGVRFCPTATLADRVRSWDGVPLDVDVTLPPSSVPGPYPTLVMEHGFPGDKRSFQASSPEGNGGSTYHYNDNFYARRGYLVVTYSARGFGASCGVPASRTEGCERGWTHIADHRFENRDAQHLLGLLVDAGLSRADALGVTGVSGGGGRSIGLAYLRDRIRLPDGTFRRWLSPRGTPLEIAAAFPRWGWYDLTTALVPNGRPRSSRTPIGIPKRTWIDLLYAGGTTGFIAPPGADPQADLTTWRTLTMREPPDPAVSGIAQTLTQFVGGAAGLRGYKPAPLMIENGWTDELFPADEALRAAAGATRPKLLLGDLGHGWAGNPRRSDRVFNDLGADFFRIHLQPGRPRPPVLPPDVQAYVSACPKGKPGRRLSGPSLASMQRGRIELVANRAQRYTSRGGRPSTAGALNGAAGDWCAGVRSRRERNSATYQATSPGFTLLGSPTVEAKVRTRGDGGQIAARLWEVRGARQRLIARGLYRLRDDQRGRVRFALHPNAYRFGARRRFKLELLGSDAPYAQAPQRAFSVRVQRLRLVLPTRERGIQGVTP